MNTVGLKQVISVKDNEGFFNIVFSINIDNALFGIGLYQKLF